MRAITKFATAAVAALSFAAVSASAQAAVYISFDGTTDAAVLANGVYGYVADCGGADDCGGFETVTITGDTSTFPTLLHSQNVDVNNAASGAADIEIWVTHTDIDGPDYNQFASTFTSNNAFFFDSNFNMTTPFTVTLETFVSASNDKYTGTPLSSWTTSAPGASATNMFAGGNAGSGLYSVTHKYTIHADNWAENASSSPSIILTGVAVPEPTTWALMIMGFGGAGAMLRSRRKGVAVAA